MNQNRDGIAAIALLLLGASVASQFAASAALTLSAPWSPLTDDVYLYRLDRLVGYDSLRVMAAYPRLGLLRLLSEYTYLSLPFALMAGVGMVVLRRAPRVLVPRFVIASILGLLLYQIIPAVGPAMLSASELHGPLHPIPADLHVWRNAFPSLHLIHALLLFPAWGRLRWLLGTAFITLTAMTCLGDGQHYLVDLLAGIPFTALIVWLLPRRA